MLNEVLRRDTLSQAGRARAAKAKPQTDVERLLERQSNAVWSLFGDAVFAVLVASSVAWGLASIGHYKGWLHLDKLLHGLDGNKDQFYALYALSQCLSSAAMWAEPYLCDSLLVKYGGHVVFDYSIPLGFILYLAAASRMAPRKAKAA